MKIYLAARFSRRHECHELGKVLQQHGHTIVSRWTLPSEEKVEPVGQSKLAAPDDRRRFAIQDLEDIDQCDCCISLMEEPRNDGRGGRHVEFGYALAKGKKMISIGPKETVFHELDEVRTFSNIDCFIDHLKSNNL